VVVLQLPVRAGGARPWSWAVRPGEAGGQARGAGPYVLAHGTGPVPPCSASRWSGEGEGKAGRSARWSYRALTCAHESGVQGLSA
jgi:hypothetical protein